MMKTKAQKKISKVMTEFGKGKLTTNKKVVTDPKQAMAIALSKAGSSGGDPNEWSARKAQLLAKEYKAKGGGYKT